MATLEASMSSSSRGVCVSLPHVLLSLGSNGLGSFLLAAAMSSAVGTQSPQVRGQNLRTTFQPMVCLEQCDLARSHVCPLLMRLKPWLLSAHAPEGGLGSSSSWSPRQSSTTSPSRRKSATEHSGGGGSAPRSGSMMPCLARWHAHQVPKRSTQSTCVRGTKGRLSMSSRVRCTLSTAPTSLTLVSRKTTITLVGTYPAQYVSMSSRKSPMLDPSGMVSRCGRPTRTCGAMTSARPSATKYPPSTTSLVRVRMRVPPSRLASTDGCSRMHGRRRAACGETARTLFRLLLPLLVKPWAPAPFSPDQLAPRSA
mmetsp:Transcript_10164/g.30061  ORF Transcript_10164/g.30061 Transcript_10164/m.30061 type:complete len:311 (+) Transcript_10164:1275-2207(+)